MSLFLNKKDQIEYEFLPEALEVIETPPSKASRLIIWGIFLILVAAIVWACIGEVDEVATSRGKIIADGRTKVVQANSSGEIKEIYVKEGQEVTTGDLMFLLDDEKETVDIDALKEEVAVLSEEVDIYNTILKGKTPTDNDSSYARAIISKNNTHLQKENELTLVALQYETQHELELQRLEKSKSEIEVLELNKKLLEKKYNARLSQELELEKLAITLENAKREESRIRTLVESGATAEIELINILDQKHLIEEEMKIQKNIIETERMNQEIDLEKLDSQIALAQKDIALQEVVVKQVEDKITAAVQSLSSYRSEKESTYRDVIANNEKKISELLVQENKVVNNIEDLEIRASATGIVQGIANNTVGGIVTPAQVLATIVPKGEPLMIEAYLQNKDIGFVDVGQEVSVKFDTFSYQKYGLIKGKVVYISPDATEIENVGTVYVIKVELAEKSMEIEGKTVYFVPGMTVTAEVTTGKRKIIEFFLEPLIKYAQEGFNLR